jgi:hypothetical protein
MSLTLRVRAIDETGAPVTGALVRRDDETVATTDTDGIAIVDCIGTGWDSVTVSHAMPAEVQLSFMLGEGSSGMLERTVTLRRGAPLRGTVVAPDGSPVADAQVEVWSATGTTFVETNADGTWCVPAMLAGPYEARARADGYARSRATVGTHDGTEQHGVVLRVATGARLHGRVRTTAGLPVVGVRVYTELQPGDDQATTTDDAGRFEIRGLGAGNHRVHIGDWTSSVVMPGDGGQHELDIELPVAETTADSSQDDSEHDEPAPAPRPIAALTGRVVRGGAPVSQFAIVRKGFDRYHWITRPAIIHASDGRFTLTELRERSCTVHVLAVGSAWASTATIDLSPGSTMDLGDIELPRGLRIAGTVCNAAGDPIGGARVLIGTSTHDADALSDAVAGHFATASRSDGTFVFDGIAVGDVPLRLSARHSIHGASLEHVLSGSDETVRIVLVPTGSIDGEIEPYSGTHGGVIIRADAPQAGTHVAMARPSGCFTVEHLVPGDYTLELIEHPRLPRREARATVVAGQRTRVRMPPP